MAWLRANYDSGSESIPLVSWSTGTDAEIIAMLQGYYNGIIPLSVIQSVWSIGDKRSISLSAMEATDVTESHHADNYDFIIIDFDHDLLTTPINGITKALITIQQDRILYKNTTDVSFTSMFPSSSDEGGVINLSGSNIGGWDTCNRRTWCNSIYYNAFPQYIKDNIKEVYKSTTEGGDALSPMWIANTDKCFLLSAREIFSDGIPTSYTPENGNYITHYINKTSDEIIMPTGGDNYKMFFNTTDRYKKPTYYTNESCGWWTRTPAARSRTHFCITSPTGLYTSTSVNSNYGIAPAFCL